ncbi:hypothetical protein ACWIEX_02460 [Bosea sp. NPDC055353]
MTAEWTLAGFGARFAARWMVSRLLAVDVSECEKMLRQSSAYVPLRYSKAGRRAVLLSSRNAGVWMRTGIVIALAVIIALPMIISL